MLVLPGSAKVMASVLYAQTTVQSMVSFLLASPPSSLSYPTSFTQGIEPKVSASRVLQWVVTDGMRSHVLQGIHSHNDCEQ